MSDVKTHWYIAVKCVHDKDCAVKEKCSKIGCGETCGKPNEEQMGISLHREQYFLPQSIIAKALVT